jgi:hypothetical protein
VIKRLAGFFRSAGELVILGQAGQSLSVFVIGEKNLLPDLDGHIGPSARLQCMGFLHQNGTRGICRAGGLVLGVTHLERQQQAARDNATLSESL